MSWFRLVLITVVLRPIARQMIAGMSQTPSALALPGAEAAAPNRLAAAQARAAMGPSEAQGIHEHVSEFIRKEPAQSTRLLESWIGAPREAE